MGQSLSGDAAGGEAIACLEMALDLLDRKGLHAAACYVSMALDAVLSEQGADEPSPANNGPEAPWALSWGELVDAPVIG